MTDSRSSAAGAGPGNRHLVHIGYPKTGSKYLQHWFSAHPEIGFSPWGIAGFRDAHELMTEAGRGAPGPAWHVTSHEALTMPFAEYRDLGTGGDRPLLPTGREQRAACNFLASLFGGATILLVTRGFEALIDSLYAEFVLGGASYGFERFREAIADLAAANDDPFHFDRLIEDYEAAFGADRLIVLPYELLRDRPRDFLGEIERRLGIGRLDGAAGRIRPTPEPDRIALYRRLTARMRSVPLPGRIKGPLLRQWVKAMRAGRLGPLARLAGPARLGESPSGQGLSPDLIRALSGRCERLRSNPLYAGFEEQYLL
ncbi:MAG TPA: hypothetical protein VIT45_03995 [Allosphingosinicella sp.]